jgi:hypothetical protein
MEEDNKIKVWEQEREVVKDLAGQSWKPIDAEKLEQFYFAESQSKQRAAGTGPLLVMV